MMTLRKLSILAIAASLLTGISGVSHVAGTTAAPTPTTTLSTTCLTNASLTDLITCLINSVGDDTFSTIDLTTLVNPVTLTAPTPLHTTTFAPMTQDPSSNSGTSTQHYGPYTTTNDPDSGTCGNDWATDSFDRHLTVFQKDDGSLLVVEQFKDGSFVTPAPASDQPQAKWSPGGCQNSATPQGTVKDGVTGNFHGYEVIPLPSGTVQTSQSPYCDAAAMTNDGCTGTIFIQTHFTSCYPVSCPVSASVTTFFFHYSAGDQGLIMNEWQNASADRGGNSGDIRSADV
jgi:hypothetical protein